VWWLESRYPQGKGCGAVEDAGMRAGEQPVDYVWTSSALGVNTVKLAKLNGFILLLRSAEEAVTI